MECENVVHDNFNPLPRKEGDTFLKQHFGIHMYFNPLPRKEGDQ